MEKLAICEFGVNDNELWFNYLYGFLATKINSYIKLLKRKCFWTSTLERIFYSKISIISGNTQIFQEFSLKALVTTKKSLLKQINQHWKITSSIVNDKILLSKKILLLINFIKKSIKMYLLCFHLINNKIVFVQLHLRQSMKIYNVSFQTGHLKSCDKLINLFSQ